MFALLVASGIAATANAASDPGAAQPRRAAESWMDTYNSALASAGESIGDAENAAGSAVSDGAEAVQGEVNAGATATMAAGLQASGQCPTIWSVVPDIINLLADKQTALAEGLQSMDDDPATNADACAGEVQKQVNAVIEDNLQEGMGRGSGQTLAWERSAAQWAASDAGSQVCTDMLKDTLADNSGIRTSDPSAYRQAVRAKLNTGMPDLVESEINTFCPNPNPNQRLFSLNGTWYASPTSNMLSLAAACMGTAGLLLLFVAAALGARRFAAVRWGTVFYTNVGHTDEAVSP